MFQLVSVLCGFVAILSLGTDLTVQGKIYDFGQSLGNSPINGDPQKCLKENAELRLLEALPGGGWDNLRNLDTKNVVLYNYALCRTTLDGRFLIPDDMETVPVKSSKVNTFAEIIEHHTEYSSLTAQSVNVNAGLEYSGVTVSGSFAANFEHAKSKQIKDKTKTARIQLRYVRYLAKLKSIVNLEPGFKKRLLDIAASLDRNETNNARYKSQVLVRDFGTHFLHTVDAGAVLVQEDQINSDYYNNKGHEKTEIMLAASASFQSKFNLGESYNYNSSSDQMHSYQNELTSSEITIYGGPEFQASNFSVNDWAQDIDGNLVAVDRHGDPVYYLVDPINIPELSPFLVQEVQRFVKQAVELYYEYNTHRGCTNIDSDNFSPAANFDDGTCSMQGKTSRLGGTFQTCFLASGSTYEDPCDVYNMNQKNPLTGDYGCPPGYKSVLLRSADLSTTKPGLRCERCDEGGLMYMCCEGTKYETYMYSVSTYHMYWCAANGESTDVAGYLFGGFFTSELSNPITNAKTCPQYHYPHRLGKDLQICLSDDFELGAKKSIPFAGFFSCEKGNPFVNATGANSSPKKCPVGFSQHLMYVDQGCEISYCIKSGSISHKGLPAIKRPPFVAPDFLSNPAVGMVFGSKEKRKKKKKGLWC